MLKSFAKLYDTPRGQLLVTTESDVVEGESGPALRFRGASVKGVSPSVILGPWPDTDEGWAHVEQLLEGCTQEEANERAEDLFGIVTNLLSAN